MAARRSEGGRAWSKLSAGSPHRNNGDFSGLRLRHVASTWTDSRLLYPELSCLDGS